LASRIVGPDHSGKPPKDVDNVKTVFPKEPQNDWVVVDAAGQTVGRLATRLASLLRGKHKVDFTPNQAGGDYVIVINAEKVVFTGRKLDQKVYTRYTGYQGGLKTTTARVMLDKHPDRVIQHAVWGMLPKNRLGRKLIRRLKIYAGDAHPHQAQQPKALELS
jgi:large subunit ribosomal protein L13